MYRCIFNKHHLIFKRQNRDKYKNSKYKKTRKYKKENPKKKSEINQK